MNGGFFSRITLFGLGSGFFVLTFFGPFPVSQIARSTRERVCSRKTSRVKVPTSRVGAGIILVAMRPGCQERIWGLFVVGRKKRPVMHVLGRTQRAFAVRFDVTSCRPCHPSRPYHPFLPCRRLEALPASPIYLPVFPPPSLPW